LESFTLLLEDIIGVGGCQLAAMKLVIQTRSGREVVQGGLEVSEDVSKYLAAATVLVDSS